MRHILGLKHVIEWFFQRLTGIILIMGLVAHFYTMHYSGHGQIKYEVILGRLTNPYWVIFNLIFLVSVTYHGLNGLLSIMKDYVHSTRLLAILEWVLIAMGSLLVVIGINILII